MNRRTNRDSDINRERIFSWGYHDGARSKIDGRIDCRSSTLTPEAPRASAYVIGFMQGVLDVLLGDYDANDSTPAWRRWSGAIPSGDLTFLDVKIVGRSAA